MTETEFDDALTAPVAVLYKHSTKCGLSARAFDEIVDFARSHPATPVYLVDVIHDRPLAQRIAERLNIRHQSPQAIVLRRGEPQWHTSHSGVKSEAIAQQITEV